MFETMFKLPAGEGNETDGSTDENPIRLDGIKKADFEQLLTVMYLRLVVFDDVQAWCSTH